MSVIEQIAYRDNDTALTGLIVRPANAPRAAVLVFPTIMNPTPAVMTKAQSLADAGYLAFVVDFYGTAIPDIARAFAAANALRGDVDAYRARLRAALAALDALIEPDLPRLAIGFCMGGQAVLELARDNAALLAVASFHGLLDTRRKAPAGGPVGPRILVCHGDADALVPRTQVIAFWEEMDAADAYWHFHSYSGIGHGFTNPHAPPSGGPSAYDSSADRQSWAAMHSLFDEVLGGLTPGALASVRTGAETTPFLSIFAPAQMGRWQARSG